MTLFLLDTDICSYAMKRRSMTLQEKLLTFDPGVLKVSAITVFELRYGACRLAGTAKSRTLVTICAFLQNVEILNFDQQAAEHAGDIRAKLAEQGQPIGSFDLLIAAHARSINGAIVTNNTREFSRVDGLLVENWFDPTTGSA
ncbi:type II toxin-antitoxin system VapC family toxin [Nitrosomonas sp.]|uniref:type II toxin-antitoxin system VapC family toxin n=1 Tax=Nitrosomonas sp. TaxID=42353 RepID=UPI001DCC7BB8|nr:type II toxin-antitoxin system VapC family toxin [Nitrosomonas sp.]MCB1808541.1 type II toxin-antitoxin system VapC family toxin [Candidatus Competibacteraceae bacterium]MCB1950058.1 type II toxin-antitoxin system VapC family toxin [Nitrosomonas sp.]